MSGVYHSTIRSGWTVWYKVDVYSKVFISTYRAANEVPSKMSLTADELKPRAQPLTNTDLEIKQGDG